MAVSPRHRISPGFVTAVAMLAVGLAGTDAHGATKPLARKIDAVALDAASSEVDYKSNTIVFRDIVVTQGSARVAADEARATGLNFEDSEWTFSGNVKIRVDTGALASNTAIVRFTDNRISKATVIGTPAEFEQPRKGGAGTARGHAGSIVYDVSQGTVRLSSEAWLTDGRNEITGDELVYEIAQQRVKAQAPAGASQRVRITIRPQPDDAAPEAKKP
ncbi:MAG: lipopolysaccharide transport periplasmic protein LptA [Steroidobacteraceae bacterium]